MKEEYRTTLEPGTIRFHRLCEPPLESGEHQVRLEQSVELKEEKPFSIETYEKNFTFRVDGPRFSLDPEDIYAVYPPKGETGNFANTLPHVVFSRRTLPWERRIVPTKRNESLEVSERRPWLALLVMSEDDFPDREFPKIRSVTVAELVDPEPGAGSAGPALALQPGEKTELCNTIDLPVGLFRGIAPSFEELSCLAHVREVNTDHKETSSFLADGWFSVVLANRFPKPEPSLAEPAQPMENRAYLVSIEGHFPPAPSAKAAGMRAVRLAVLSSWSFGCTAAYSFKASMEKLKSGLLRVPFFDPANEEAEKRTKLSEEEASILAACDLGYTALKHTTRLGEKTVSWYRGPLVPLSMPRQTKYGFLPTADAALRYNPLDGMMDVTYAAAYQLGRLLGLQDRHFANALQAYRSSVSRQVNRVLARKRTESALGVSGEATENDLMNSYLKRLDQEDSCTWSATVPIELAGAADEGKRAGELRLTTDFDLAIPGSVSRWLARLLLLYRVPFTYLVADERMLPPDSIRFFHLDPGWLKCLLEGACSVGRSSSRDELVDEHLRDNFLKLALEESRNVRSRNPAMPSDAKVVELPETGPEWSRVTGFLLRSPLVRGWQGLEMKAWAYQGGKKDTLEPLNPLRIDRLSPDILLCIFDGEVGRIELKQPPEGMHFGAEAVGNGYRKMSLRRLEGGAAPELAEPADQISTPCDIKLRSGEFERVVDIATLAHDLKAKLQMPDDRSFTSAEFAVEMVESPGRAYFDVNPTKEAET